MHELIDKEQPKCLYCDSDCEVEHEGEWVPPAFNCTYDRDIIICSSCKEKFEIHESQAADGDTKQVGFGFTCKIYFVFFNYPENYFDLYQNQDRKYITTIPPFEVDFSDINKLYNKIKTYILFS
jgi:hypothetical protein